MLFAKNKLVLQRQQAEAGQGPIRLELNPFEALKHVNPTEDLIHVALAKEWMAARSASHSMLPLFTKNTFDKSLYFALIFKWTTIFLSRKDSPHINRIVHPYDWTFTPAGYRGTLTPEVSWTIEASNKGVIFFYLSRLIFPFNYSTTEQRE